jgi:hypothetical protein
LEEAIFAATAFRLFTLKSGGERTEERSERVSSREGGVETNKKLTGFLFFISENFDSRRRGRVGVGFPSFVQQALSTFFPQLSRQFFSFDRTGSKINTSFRVRIEQKRT